MSSNTSGLHVVRKRLRGGDRWYVYAGRGGPLIHSQDGERPKVTPALESKAQAARRRISGETVDSIVNAYRASPELAAKSRHTRREYLARLDQISEKFGAVPARLIPELGPEVIKWQDDLAETPRAADRCVGMLHTVLRWGRQRGMWRGENPAADVPKLHKANRADLIWEDRHWEALAKAPGAVLRALRLGALTGLRVGDLLKLRWEDVQDGYVAIKTGKSLGLAEAVIPLHPELGRFLIGPPGAGPILKNIRGQPWSEEGWQTAWRRARPEGFDRKVHDLRGTFATRLMVAGFTDTEIAAVMGWRAERIAAIRARYVDRSRVIRALAERMAVNRL